MMMKSVFWEETTDLRQVNDETFSHVYGLCPVRGLNLGRSGVKQSELRRNGGGKPKRSKEIISSIMSVKSDLITFRP